MPQSMQITAGTIDPALLDLPWEIPLETWPPEVLAALPAELRALLERWDALVARKEETRARLAVLVDVDLERRTLWRNDLYRPALSGSMRPDDAPLLKTLLLLLYSRFFECSHLGNRKKRELKAWDSMIVAALGEELEHRGTREGRTRE